MTMPRAELAQYVDHTLLKPEATPADVAETVAEGAELGVYSVCVSPSMIPIALPSGLKLAVVAGFPSGKHHTEVKVLEAALACDQGADEVDMVIDIAAAIEGRFDDVRADVAAVKAAMPEGRILKVIIESAALLASDLGDEAVIGACRASMEAGADFVKTSTGFHPAGGASAHAVRLMRETVGDALGVKASGGIRTAEAALEMIEAGASRLGLSGTRAVLDGLETLGSDGSVGSMPEETGGY